MAQGFKVSNGSLKVSHQMVQGFCHESPIGLRYPSVFWYFGILVFFFFFFLGELWLTSLTFCRDIKCVVINSLVSI